jgi:hypothetical protein
MNYIITGKAETRYSFFSREEENGMSIQYANQLLVWFAPSLHEANSLHTSFQRE